MLANTETLAEKVARLKEASWQVHSTPGAYVISGGVEPHYTDKPIGVVTGYRQALPKLEGRDVIEIIQGVIDAKGLARVLDIGCGSASFLSQIKNGYKVRNPVTQWFELQPGWQEKVECFGLNVYLYKFCGIEGRLERDEAVERAKYQEAGINLLIGDAQQLSALYPHQEFDVITAVYVVEHLQDPWAFFYNMYGLLDMEGVCLVRNLPFNFRTEEEEKFIANYLRNNYQAEVYDPHRDLDRHSVVNGGDLAIRKRSPLLYLPIVYHDVEETMYHPRVIYRVSADQSFHPI